VFEIAERLLMSEEKKSAVPGCEVELDIFSGRANPTWMLTDDETGSFLDQLAALTSTSARELSGNLGYRGFMVQCTAGADLRLIRIQKGIVQISTGTQNTYALDKDRALERWLLNTAKPHLQSDILHIAERGVQ
jgi:hypothetical protein